MRFVTAQQLKDHLEENCFSLVSFNARTFTYICDKVRVLVVIDIVEHESRVYISDESETINSLFDLCELDAHKINDVIQKIATNAKYGEKK